MLHIKPEKEMETNIHVRALKCIEIMVECQKIPFTLFVGQSQNAVFRIPAGKKKWMMVLMAVITTHSPTATPGSQ